ncbi:MAG: lipopolysaccharide biosynthesis protein, partial [Alphaproteobacteria bacterium]|nr:lipopolysaccharide biosynthesis protein [Alphaproteobacteria bacterium]
NAVMGALVLPLRAEAPGLATLLVQVTMGAGVYACIVLGFDVAGMRSMLITRLRLTYARMKTL